MNSGRNGWPPAAAAAFQSGSGAGKTVSLSLLAQPITIEMPLVQSGAQVDVPGNVYFATANHFYDQSSTITNSAPYQLPLTGGNGTWLTVVAGVVLLTLCVSRLAFSGDFFLRRRAVCANPQ